MTKEEVNKLSKQIEDISSNFDDKPWTDNVKLLKNDFDTNLINTPNYYQEIVSELEEILRETRFLFLCSVFNLVCKEEGKPYYFDTPFQASMRYDAVMKKEGVFYLLDEDSDYREIFTSEIFMRFVNDLYWELYQ
ncbi:MAG: hypothetical protein EAZ27_01545, partial [Cytophagales bacterium]